MRNAQCEVKADRKAGVVELRIADDDEPPKADELRTGKRGVERWSS